MVLAVPVAFGVLVGLAARGDLRRLGAVRLKRIELFYLAVALQIVAFPFSFLPWRTNDTVATALWLASYALLFVGAFASRRITGVPVIAAGMASNVIAVVANGGHMPALPDALHAAHKHYSVHFNSAVNPNPHLPWLVDRWAVPHWFLVGNVYSLGDVVIAVGVVLVVAAAMQPPLLLFRRARDGVASGDAPYAPPRDVTRQVGTTLADTSERLRPAPLGPISPELALVSPELAARARTQLPTRPWEMFLPGAPAPNAGALT